MGCPPGSKSLIWGQWHGLDPWRSHFAECPRGGLQHAECDRSKVVCLTAGTVLLIREGDWRGGSGCGRGGQCHGAAAGTQNEVVTLAMDVCGRVLVFPVELV